MELPQPWERSSLWKREQHLPLGLNPLPGSPAPSNPSPCKSHTAALRTESGGPQNENWPAGLTHFPLSQQLSLAKHAHQTNIPSARHHLMVFSVIRWEHHPILLPFLTPKFQFSSVELYFLFVTFSFIHPTKILSVLQKQTQRKRMTEELGTSLKKLHSLSNLIFLCYLFWGWFCSVFPLYLLLSN